MVHIVEIIIVCSLYNNIVVEGLLYIDGRDCGLCDVCDDLRMYVDYRVEITARDRYRSLFAVNAYPVCACSRNCLLLL